MSQIISLFQKINLHREQDTTVVMILNQERLQNGFLLKNCLSKSPFLENFPNVVYSMGSDCHMR